MTDSDRSLITKPAPIDKRCKICKTRKLLTDFDFSNRTNDKRTTICKTCVEKLEEEEDDDYGACCEYHFDEAVFGYTMSNLSHTLDMIGTLQANRFGIPEELLNRMRKIIEKEEFSK